MKYEIGNRIRKYREECKLSQKDLAQKLGVSNSRVSNWEQGINRPGRGYPCGLVQNIECISK